MHAKSPESIPASLWVAVIGAAASALAIIGVGVASLLSGHAAFSGGIGAMLVGYGLVVGLGAWLGLRRHPLARGLIVAPALLNLATSLSLLTGGDPAQSIGAGLAGCLFAAIVVAALLPASRAALGHRA